MQRKTAFFHPGAGLAASIGNASLFIATDTASAPAGELVSLFRESAVTATDSVGVVRALARVVAQYSFESVPPFACVIAGNEDVHALVYGQLHANVRTTHSDGILDGSVAVTWADRRFEGTLVEFAVGDSVDPTSSWFFEEGIVPAAGLLVSTSVGPAPTSLIDLTDRVPAPPDPLSAPRGVDLPPPPPPPLSAPPVSHEMPTKAETTAVRAQQPIPSDHSGRTATLIETRAVAGMACVNGHLNRPDAAQCEWCSADLDRARGTIVGVRPSLGVLVFDEGEREVDLVRPVIVGASPPTDVVIAGEDAETVLIDAGMTGVSDTQFEVHFESWDVFVIDRSTTGTFLDDPSGRRHRLPRHARVKLKQGSVIAFGDHTVRVVPAH